MLRWAVGLVALVAVVLGRSTMTIFNTVCDREGAVGGPQVSVW